MTVRVHMCGRPMLRYGLLLLALLFAALSLESTGVAFAQQKGEPPVTLILRGDEAPEALKRTLDALQAGGRSVTLQFAGKDAPAAPAATPATVSAAANAPTASREVDAKLDTFWDNFASGVDYGNSAIPAVAALPDEWARAWARNANGVGSGVSATLRALIVFALAAAVALLFRWITAGWFAPRLAPAGATFTARLVASLHGLLQDGLTIGLVLAAVRLGGALLLPEPDLAARTLRIVGNAAAIGLSYAAGARFLLAPGAPERRLLPLPRADLHFKLFAVYAFLTPVVVTSTILAQWVTSDQLAAAGLFAVTGLAITLLKLAWFVYARHDLAALVRSASPSPGPGLRLLAVLTPWIYAAIAVLIWMVGRAAAMMSDGGRWAEAAGQTQVVVGLAPILAVGIGSYLACKRMRRAAVQAPTPMEEALGKTAQAAAVGFVWAAGFVYLARLWTVFLVNVDSPEFGVFLRQAVALAVLVFAGWVTLVFLRAFFDAYTPKPAASLPGDEDVAHEDHVPSRLATVLPVMRGVVLGAVIGLTGLVVLSKLGVDIGPLLAGFGILGLAISFGSQALVRDIVSGFFFMLEDAFRVGEYVDNGRLKGTVEKISLRSMQLRHQSGQIHTVPFGQIASLTNSSRDWATLKFNIRLDHSADIEKARKTIKKAGLALLEDPEFGPHFIAPLKMQGVADIADSAIVIRLKFTAKPAHASMLQREALKRVYRGLIEAGVPFASNAVTVRGGEERATAAAIVSVPPPTPLAPVAS